MAECQGWCFLIHRVVKRISQNFQDLAGLTLCFQPCTVLQWRGFRGSYCIHVLSRYHSYRIKSQIG